MNLKEAFEILHDALGTHKAAAAYLGISWSHYSNLRNGIVPIPKRTADLIILKAQEATASDTLGCTYRESNEAVSV